MRPRTALACAALILATPALTAAHPVQLVAVCFTPGEDCTGLIVRAIDAAGSTIRVQAYELTSRPIAAALVAAHGRGVDVAVIIDHTAASQRYSEARELESAGVKVLIDHVAGIAHNKVVIIDGARVITGSFNFTASAQNRNAENVIEIDDVDLADRFSANWASRLPHTTPYEQR